MYDAPSYIWALVLAAAIGLPASAGWVLYRGALGSGLTRATARTIAITALALLGAWLAISATLSWAGIYSAASPWFGIAFIGVLAALLIGTRVPAVSRALSAPGNLVRLTIPHTLRVVGVGFLIVMFLGDLPWQFALPAALGDIAAGIAAPFVALQLSRGGGLVRAAWFNAFGLLDLIAAIAIGFIGGLGPWYPFAITPTTDPLALLPLALVPTVAVPIAITLHIVAIRQLWSMARPRNRVDTGIEAALRHG